MKKCKGKAVIAGLLIVSLLGACGTGPADGSQDVGQSGQGMEGVQLSQSGEDASDSESPSDSANPVGTAGQLVLDERPKLINLSAVEPVSMVVPTVKAYTIEPDFSNIDNADQFYLQDEMGAKLAQNGFVVSEGAGSEFYEIYETNRYSMIPNFVTVDSLMHTYHLYFAYLLKNVERTYLADRVAQLGNRMLEGSIAQYDQLIGTEWESAAARNVAFFTIGSKLLDDNTVVNDYVADMVSQELGNISQADSVQNSAVTGEYEDYSQYAPRGYYEGDPRLEAYFRAMMWYGRIHFRQEEEDLDRSALLMAKALSDDAESYQLWEAVYAVTSFFAGASDDSGVCEYAPIIREAYGEDAGIADLPGNQEAFNYYHALTKVISTPQINSVPIEDGEENVISGFRFMGQRFTIDAAIMQKLIYSNVQANSAGVNRMLPDTLDVPAALGSDVAMSILQANGATDYAGYLGNMERLRAVLGKEENNALWSASLYASWLNTLRPLLEAKGEGYPVFMQSEEWMKKNLECFAGSFTELKHDTVLYSKQVMAEMGGGYEENDFRGYVEPEPLVYSRFGNLASLTIQGLKRYGMLDAADEENMNRLAQIANQLLTISKKELREEPLTEEEHEFIKGYGGSIEHLWRQALRDENGGERIDSREYPAAVVTDIATDPNGQVLEVATGNPSTIMVVVNVEGSLRIARGSVYTFYQFPWPLSDRLTDSKWRQMMGLQADEEGNYNYDSRIAQPEWTRSYRYVYEW